MLKTADIGQTKIQLGNNKNLVDIVLLARQKLLEFEKDTQNPTVDSEAFFITDGDPQAFCMFSRLIWRSAEAKTTSDQTRVIQGGLPSVWPIGSTEPMLYYLRTSGRNAPPLKIIPLRIQYTINKTTYDISKARVRLGYTPVVDTEGHIRSSVAWGSGPLFGKYRTEC